MKIEVVMSTYNGEKYINEQINSIFQQEEIDVHLTVRDDGSTDNTKNILNEIYKKYPDKVKIIEGVNLGYRKSFMYALKEAVTADYYAFSDQDDVWLSNKFSQAVNNLNNIDSEIKLYASSVQITNEKLEKIGFNDISNMSNNIECYFCRPRLAGCTFVFSPALRLKALKLFDEFNENTILDFNFPDHDFIVGTIGFAFGKVYLDKQSYILHRRIENSVTSGGNGFYKRIKTEYNCFFKRKNYRYFAAKYLLKNTKEFNSEVFDFLKIASRYNSSLKNKIKLLHYKNFSSNIFICDIETKISVLLGTF